MRDLNPPLPRQSARSVRGGRAERRTVPLTASIRFVGEPANACCESTMGGSWPLLFVSTSRLYVTSWGTMSKLFTAQLKLVTIENAWRDRVGRAVSLVCAPGTEGKARTSPGAKVVGVIFALPNREASGQN
jgi:hypothetical protein